MGRFLTPSGSEDKRTVPLSEYPAVGRFAPSPSGFLHLGNLLASLLAWLDCRSLGGEMVFRLEDLDPARSGQDFASAIVDDLHWLGLDWDRGWPEDPSYAQSERTAIYDEAFQEQWKGWLEKYNLTPTCYDAFLENHIYDNRMLSLGEQIEMMQRDLKCASILGFPCIRTLVSTKENDTNKEIVRQILKEDLSNFLNTDFIL